MFRRLALNGAGRAVALKAARTTARSAVARGSFYASNGVLASPTTRSMATTTTTGGGGPADPAMFCRQCEQTKDAVACTALGVCGKTPETSAIQDALMQVLKCVSLWSVAARKAGATPEELKRSNVWTLKAVFSTMTNVNFSESRIREYIMDGMNAKTKLQSLVESHGGEPPTGDVAELSLGPDLTLEELEGYGSTVGVLQLQAKMGNDDAFALKELATYGAKGVSAYAMHCHQLGQMDDESILAPLHEVWAKVSSDEPDVEGYLAAALKVGEINAKTLALLDDSHASKFGAPEPTQVRVTAVRGNAILISGHDMADLHALLEQTEGMGINVYTHGEMLPAHQYPELKKFKHLAGNYGTAWQNQKFEFALFPGPIVMTTNCMIEPRRVYKKRIFTMNEVGFDGVQHIGEERDFSKVIEEAKKDKGFPNTIEPARYHTVGFNHRAVLPLADKVIEAAKSGALSRILLIGGCDGSEWDRNYFSDLAEESPDDSLILTMGCAKNRIINNERLMESKLANGLPRVMDMGQCNDSYSAVVVATELAKALDCEISDLPLSFAWSHMEQKAIAVFLTLLHLGVQNVRLGPKLPAYITPDILNVLKKNYHLMPTGHAEGDLKAMMAGR